MCLCAMNICVIAMLKQLFVKSTQSNLSLFRVRIELILWYSSGIQVYKAKGYDRQMQRSTVNSFVMHKKRFEYDWFFSGQRKGKHNKKQKKCWYSFCVQKRIRQKRFWSKYRPYVDDMNMSKTNDEFLCGYEKKKGKKKRERNEFPIKRHSCAQIQ